MSHISGNFLIQKKFPTVMPATRSVIKSMIFVTRNFCLLILGIILITIRCIQFCGRQTFALKSYLQNFFSVFLHYSLSGN